MVDVDRRSVEQGTHHFHVPDGRPPESAPCPPNRLVSPTSGSAAQDLVENGDISRFPEARGSAFERMSSCAIDVRSCGDEQPHRLRAPRVDGRSDGSAATSITLIGARTTVEETRELR